MATPTKMNTVNNDDSEYTGSRFSEVRAKIMSDPYTTLPRPLTTIGPMFKRCVNILKRDSIRRLKYHEDLIPRRPKLLHRAGICMFGKWSITEDNDHTGCFSSGTNYLIVIRCSTLLSQTHHGERRGFGLAGKIFPTLDPNELVKTANFVTIDVLGGTNARHYTDVALTNDPALGVNLGLIWQLLVITNVLFVFNTVDSKSNFRPLTKLAETGLKPGEMPKTPTWMQLTADETLGKSDALDFREELRLKNYKDGLLRFWIAVADETSPKGERLWRRIGKIELTEDVCSTTGDECLRFQHNPNRT